MKRTVLIPIIAILFTLFMTAGFIYGTDGYEDIMHPRIPFLDADGKPVTDPVLISTQITCGQCHDTDYINSHNNHYTETVKTGCVVCHFKERRIGEDLENAHRDIRLPSNQNCAHCHGLLQVSDDPLDIPADYAHTLRYTEGEKYYGITQNTGVILAAQNLSNSYLNIRNKKDQHGPWDVHTRRQLYCNACHFVKNSPRFCGDINMPLGHLRKDPRKVQSPRQYLKRPDHNLLAASCTCCHDAFVIHDWMPYKNRHLTVLSCQSCHVPEIYGPAFKAVDKTVLTAEGTPRIEYRGVDESKSHGDSLNTKYFEGYRPFLFPHENPGGGYIVSPFNLVTTYYWKSGETGEEVPGDVLESVFLSNGQYQPEILKLFDKNNDNKIDNNELALDSNEKTEHIKTKLSAAGIADPQMVGTVEAFKINHGVTNSEHMTRECNHCHAGESRFGQDVMLSSGGPVGVKPQFMENTLPLVNGDIHSNPGGGAVLRRTASLTGHYVFGHSRIQPLDQIGVWLFLLALGGILVHGGLRVYHARKHPHPEVKSKTVYMYVFYERLWHWTMASAIIVLAFTGLEIHYAGSFTFFGLDYAVTIHNVLAAVLVINAFLSLFYHLATGHITQFFGFNRKFIQETIVQAFFYVSGIFRRSRHPIQKSLERKLNPLQQLTYIGLLNVLLPFQVITGILIWGAGTWPGLSQKVGGLTYLGPIHNLGSWLFLAFLAVHMYLTTTGHTVLSNIKAMITGYDEVEDDEPEEEHKHLVQMPVIDLVGTLIGQFGRKKESPQE